MAPLWPSTYDSPTPGANVVKKTVTIVGVGALGSHLALLLRNEAHLTFIDFDRVEAKNVLAQFHGKPQTGKLKVASLNQTLQFLFGVAAIGLPHKLTKDNVQQLLKGGALIVDCLDNFEARTLVQEYARANNRPCLHGALAPNGQYGRVVWDEDFTIDSEAGAGAATCENGDFLPFIALVSSYLAHSAQTFLKDGKKVGYEISPAGAFST